MTFGERLTQLRKEHGFKTRSEFAEVLGIPSTTLRNYETDVREPGHTFLKQISEYFNVSVDYLLCLTDDKEVLNSFRLKSSEYELIKKYRALDERGKEIIDTTLNNEIKRIKDEGLSKINKLRNSSLYKLLFSDNSVFNKETKLLFDEIENNLITLDKKVENNEISTIQINHDIKQIITKTILYFIQNKDEADKLGDILVSNEIMPADLKITDSKSFTNALKIVLQMTKAKISDITDTKTNIEKE